MRGWAGEAATLEVQGSGSQASVSCDRLGSAPCSQSLPGSSADGLLPNLFLSTVLTSSDLTDLVYIVVNYVFSNYLCHSSFDIMYVPTEVVCIISFFEVNLHLFLTWF